MTKKQIKKIEELTGLKHKTKGVFFGIFNGYWNQLNICSYKVQRFVGTTSEQHYAYENKYKNPDKVFERITQESGIPIKWIAPLAKILESDE